MKRGILAAVVVGAAAVLVVLWRPTRVGSGPAGSASKKELIVALENEVATLDPVRIVDVYSMRVAGQIYESLVTLDEGLRLAPCLAERWESDSDKRVWRFHLRKGVVFHATSSGAGESPRFCAEDVVFSLTRALSKGSAPAFALMIIKGAREVAEGTAATVSGLKAIDENAVEITLTRPDVLFPYRLTMVQLGMIPRSALAAPKAELPLDSPVGTGPFRFVSKSPTEVVLERFPSHWRADGGEIQRLVYRVVKNETIRIAELRNRHIDFMAVPLGLAAAMLEPDPGSSAGTRLRGNFGPSLRLAACRTLNSHYIALNCDKVPLPLRRAVAAAVNRPELVEAVTRGTGVAAAGPIPTHLPGYAPQYGADKYDTAAARAAVAAAGPSPVLKLLAHDQEASAQICEIVQARLGTGGIRVEIEQADFNTAVSRIIKGDFEAVSMFFEYPFAAAGLILPQFFSEKSIPLPNVFRFRDAAFESALAGLAGMTDETAMNARAAALEKNLLDFAPAAFLFQKRDVYVYPAGLGEISFRGTGIPEFSRMRISTNKD